MKRLTVLGVTGCVGRRTLELVEQFPDEFRLEGMAARGSDPALVAALCTRHRPRVLALTDPAAVDRVVRAISAPLPEILSGPEGLVTLAGQVDADIVLSAIVGGAGLLPTMAAIQSGKAVALANKETLVMAGSLMTAAAREGGVPLLVEARQLIADFQSMIRTKSLANLEPWLKRGKSSLVVSFANGVMKDLDAVRAAKRAAAGGRRR
jgi:1-deoxy-D-xylulose-5-phosphate reductoisomerase